MKKIFLLIGGGEISNAETKKLDLEIKKLCQNTHPKILFFPIAAYDSDGYISTFKKYFKKLGFVTDYCKLSIEKHTDIKRKVLWADALYFGGGNTTHALEELKKINFLKLLRCRKKKIVIAGISAGAMIWCKKIILCDDNNNFNIIDGLGLIDIKFRPHYTPSQETELRKMLRNEPCYGIPDRSAIIYAKNIRFLNKVESLE